MTIPTAYDEISGSRLARRFFLLTPPDQQPKAGRRQRICTGLVSQREREMTEVLNYIRALDTAARAFDGGDDEAINQAHAKAIAAEKAFDATGKRSRDFPGVQKAERRFHLAVARYDHRIAIAARAERG
jgi:hypothetical protein